MAENSIRAPLTFLVSGYGKKNEPSLGMYREDPGTGEIKNLWMLDSLYAPSYMALDKEEESTWLYTFEKDPPGGAVLSYEITDEGSRLLSRYASDYLGPCHISVSDKKDMVFAASYGKGTVAAFSVEEDHSLEHLCTWLHEGHGGHLLRQDRAHAHFTMEKEGILYTVDLGQDRVILYDVDHDEQVMVPADREIIFPPGTGPRHLVMDPCHRDRLYVLSELTAEVFFCRLEKSEWKIRGSWSALPGKSSDPSLEKPETADPLSIGAAVKISEDGKYLFVSCRLGYQCISVFRVEDDGTLVWLDTASCGGITPRDLALSGDRILIANQDSDALTFMEFDRDMEKLTLTDKVLPFRAPTCVIIL